MQNREKTKQMNGVNTVAYVVTKFSKYHSNVVGDYTEVPHPDFIVLPSGQEIRCDSRVRENVILANLDKKISMYIIHDQIKFKVLSEWDNDCDRNGSSIRWKVPKGSKLIWRAYDYNTEQYKEIIKERVV